MFIAQGPVNLVDTVPMAVGITDTLLSPEEFLASMQEGDALT
ncbi:hypothetical protein [Aerococcus urinae]